VTGEFFQREVALTSPKAIAIFPAVKAKQFLLLAAFAAVISFNSIAQTNAPAAPPMHKNDAIIPVPRTGSITNRQTQVLQRAKNAPGDYDLEFIGDSITQGWEGGGKNVWKEFYGPRKAINFGVSGDRTQHVLWRFENGQLDGIKAKVAIVMIGTNNSNKDDNSETDILEGVTAIVNQIRTRQPDTKVLLLGIFPRGKTFSTQRGKILQVNQALAKLDDGQHIFYFDFGSQLIENDGSISKDIMPDALHPNEAGYKIWASAMEPKIKELLGEI
jgi:beta-glucosidase